LGERSLRLVTISLVILSFIGSAFAEDPPRYLAFQVFTATADSRTMRRIFPPPPKNLLEVISDLRDRIGVAGTRNRRVGFIVGPIAFDNTDEQVRELIALGFDTALKTGVAVGFHIDDSMFWGRLKELNAPENIEWLDWSGTPNTGRRLDWDPPNATKISPQLCLNSKGVQSAVSMRATLIGKEIAKGFQKLQEAGEGDLFIGVISGWETEIGNDFDTRKSLGYCALTNAGYSDKNQPADMDDALSKIVQEFIELWARALTEAGAPAAKVYSHIAFASEKSISSAFCDSCVPGLSTYPFPGILEAWRRELAKHGRPRWASCEGTAMDPRDARRGGRGIGMEAYLGNLFNHGAVLVNLFGWRLGDENNPFRKIAEGPDALAAYRIFLRGEALGEAPIPDLLASLPANLRDKIHKVQAALPSWLQAHGSAQIQDNIEKLKQAVGDQRFDDAEKSVDAILKKIGQ
jgi:hypothetical protein